MSSAKIAISLDEKILREIDGLVKRNIFPSRSRAIQEAVKDKLTKISKNRLASECAKLDADTESRLAEEGMNEEMDQWPEY